MTSIYIGIGLFSLLGVVLLIKGLRRVWRRGWLMGSVQSVTGALFMSLALLSMALAMNLYSYQVFNQEQDAAEVRIEQLGPQFYRLYFIPMGQAAQLFEVRGDEWQVDARVLKWHGFATMLGFKTVYRMERLSGRYRDVKQERADARSVFALSPSQGFDLWQWSRKYQERVPWVDAVYGSAAYMPLANRAVFKVTVSTSGLVVRAQNEAARQAMVSWQ